MNNSGTFQKIIVSKFWKKLKNDQSLESSYKISKLPLETFMEEIKPVFIEKYKFECRDKSNFLTIFENSGFRSLVQESN